MESKKPGLAVLIAGKVKKKMDKEPKGEKYSEMAQEIIDAVKADDAKALGSALKHFVSVCGSDYDEDEE